VRIDEGSKETFGVIAWTCQFFEDVGFGAGVASVEQRVGCHARNVNAMRSAIATLENATASVLWVV
jgi:hypothetical protein